MIVKFIEQQSQKAQYIIAWYNHQVIFAGVHQINVEDSSFLWITNFFDTCMLL